MSAVVLLADANDIVRKGLSCSLAASRRVRRVIEAADADAALRVVGSEAVDVAIVGTSVIEDGAPLLPKLSEASPGLRTIVIAHDDTAAALNRAVSSGAHGLLGTTSTEKDLWKALDAVIARRPYVASSLKQILVATLRSDDASRDALTKRERTILRFIGEGASNGEIAAKLGLSRRTVDTHRTRLMRKLRIHKTAGLVRYAVREGLVEP